MFRYHDIYFDHIFTKFHIPFYVEVRLDLIYAIERMTLIKILIKNLTKERNNIYINHDKYKSYIYKISLRPIVKQAPLILCLMA